MLAHERTGERLESRNAYVNPRKVILSLSDRCKGPLGRGEISLAVTTDMRIRPESQLG